MSSLTITKPSSGDTDWGVTLNTALDTIVGHANTHNHGRIKENGYLTTEPNSDDPAFGRVLVTDASGNRAWINSEVKKSAFNKSFGDGENDVARGNHTHNEIALKADKTYVDNAIGNLTISVSGKTPTISITGSGASQAVVKINCNIDSEAFLLEWTIGYKWNNGEFATGSKNNTGEFTILKPSSGSNVWNEQGMASLTITATARNPFIPKESSETTTHTETEVTMYNIIETDVLALAVAANVNIRSAVINGLKADSEFVNSVKTATSSS